MNVFLLCHVFAGVALGVAVQPREGTGAAVAAAVAGAIFPDLIDKPLGYLLLGGSLHQGRIFFHTLILALLILLAALMAGRERWGNLPLLFAGGILLHQLLDQMWLQPVHWLYPLMGPFPAAVPLDFFRWSLQAELRSVSEWVFLIPVAAVTLALFHAMVPGTRGSLLRSAGQRAVPLMVPLLSALAVAGVLAALTLLPFPLMVGATPLRDGTIALVACAGAVILSWHRGVLAGG
ncbi:MAG: metal-dependent hydrolase [Methanomicrobiales archaeon]|nr:metal-dependent hydrolase [Methanomicrobiales archaeon]